MEAENCHGFFFFFMQTRSSFTLSDGTFRINNLSRTDGGEYILKSFDLKGYKLKPVTLKLNIRGK